MADTTARGIFANQGYHLLAWVVLGGLLCLEARRVAGVGTPPVWGLPAGQWLLASWVVAALHQGWVWFFWRMELHGGRISAWFGPRGFLFYRVGFALLASARILAVVLVSPAAPGTLGIPRWLSWGLVAFTTPPILWGLFSVVAYFGVTRAFGEDHFDAKYRGAALETRGIFRYVPNAMYTVVLLALYHPALLARSRLGLEAALAHHLFVWVHYFCTERPDMREIYGPGHGRGA